MAVTTWDGSSSTDWNTAANWDTGAVPTSSDDVIIPDTSSINNCELSATGGNPKNVKSLQIQANGTIVGNGIQIRVFGKNSSGFAVDNDGIIDGGSTLFLEVKTDSASTCDFNGTSGNFHSVTINHASCDATFHTDTTFGGNLTISAGTLKPQGGSTIDVNGDVVISSGATFGVSTGTGTHRFGSLTVEGTHVATSGETIIDNERSNGRAVDIVGTFTHNTGTLSIQTSADTDLRWPSSSQAYNLRINNASCIARPTGDNKPVIANNLTISAGTFNTLDAGGSTHHGLTVQGDTTGAGTLALNNSTYTGGGSGSSLSMTGTVTIGTSAVITNVDQLGESGGTITCTGSPTLGCERWRQPPANWTPATSTLKIENNNRQFQTNGYGTPYNLEIDNSGETNELSDFVVVTNNLTITAGTLDTSSSNRALTVTGDVIVGDASGSANTAVITGNASTITFGSLEIKTDGKYDATSGTTEITSNASHGYALRMHTSGGTLTHNNGTFKFTKTGDAHIRCDNELHDVILEGGNSASDLYYREKDGGNGPLTITGTLTIVEGVFRPSNNANQLVVDEGVTIEDGGTLGGGSDTGAMIFGGMTIENNGTYNATTSTTTLKGGANLTANRCMKISTNGVYNHNGGTLNVTGTDWGGSNYAHLWVPDGFDFGNVTINAGGADAKYYQFREGAGTMNFNDVYCKSGEWRDYNNNNTFNIRGNLDIGTRGAGGTNATLFGSDARDNANTTKLIVGGLVTNYTNGQFHVPYGTDGTDGCKISGLRNTGGTVYGDTA